jgi:6-phosphogluconolactonase (cycloisomerase 2 family)
MLAYAVDTETCVLTPLDASATLRANVQYACAARSGQVLYVVSSNGGPGAAGNVHYLTAFEIDPAMGALRRLGDGVALRQRPIHVTTDILSEHVLITYNNPSAISVHRILPDGGIGAEVPQPHDLDLGIYAHETRIVASNQAAIVVARGNNPTPAKAEDPGALKVFKYSNGVLNNWASVAPAGGIGFGPRNVDLDSTCGWIYVSLERQNKLATFKVNGLTIADEPSFQCDTLDDHARVRPMQLAGAVQVHPKGRFVYLANRAFGTTEDEGAEVFAGGENTIVVYAIDDATGEPRRVQSIATEGIYPRTFSIDASGSVLIVGNSRTMLVREGANVSTTAANVSVFAIKGNGRLEHKRSYEVDRSGEQLFWSGLV